MKHALKLVENSHPLRYLFVCANCGDGVRFSKRELRQLLRGNWAYGYDFLPPCSPAVPEVMPSRAARERRMKGYVIGD